MSEHPDNAEVRRRPTAPLDLPADPGPARERVDSVRKARGLWRDTVIRRDPETGAEEVVEDTGWQSNRITVGMTRLLAGLLKNEPTFNGGILFHAMGRGSPTFDVALPNPSFDEETLRDEYFRKAPDSMVFVEADGSAADPGEYTGSLLITTTLDFGEANGASDGEIIREQGLYGGPATSAADSGLLANLIFHKPRYKNSTVKIVRKIQLIF